MLIIPYTGWVIMRNYGKTIQTADSKIVNVVIGSVGTMARRDVLIKIGGFDEKLGHKVDDIDMGWRIWLAGFKTVCLPQAITYHWGGKPQSARPISSLKSEVYFHRMPRVFIKNFEAAQLVKYFPWLIGLYLVRALKHLLSGNVQPLKGFALAAIWTVSLLPDTLKERKKIQTSRKISDRELIKKIMVPGSWSYIWKNEVIPLHHTAHTVFAKRV